MKISVKNLSFTFGEKPVFSGLSVELGETNPTAVLGPSGAGKTTLLRLLGGLLAPGSGTIDREGCRKVSFVFQEHRLLPWRTVLENVAIPITRGMGKEKAEERARDFLARVSLGDKSGAYPGNLSGGEKQRAAIARAFAYPAPLLLMDEPFQSLDIPLRRKLMDLVLELLSREQRFLIAVTHDPREALYFAGRCLVLDKKGKIIYDEEGPESPDGKGRALSGERENRILAALDEGLV